MTVREHIQAKIECYENCVPYKEPVRFIQRPELPEGWIWRIDSGNIYAKNQNDKEKIMLTKENKEYALKQANEKLAKLNEAIAYLQWEMARDGNKLFNIMNEKYELENLIENLNKDVSND